MMGGGHCRPWTFTTPGELPTVTLGIVDIKCTVPVVALPLPTLQTDTQQRDVD